MNKPITKLMAMVFVIILAPLQLFAWIHTGDLDILSQADMDGLAPGLTEVTGNLIIEGNDIANIDNLGSLQTVGVDLYLHNNTILTNLDSLSSLITVGDDFEIHNNAALINVDGLSSLKTVGYWLEFHNNAALKNVDGLSSLTTIGEDLQFHNNAALTNIDGLSSLTSVDCCIEIHDNESLTNLNGLSSITSLSHDLEIINNDALVNIDGLSSLATVGDEFYINNNDALKIIDSFTSLRTVGDEIDIHHNDALEVISGFSSLKTVEDYIEIYYNPSLHSINGFESLESLDEDLEIQHNPMLKEVIGFSALESIGDDFELEYNDLLGIVDAFSNLKRVEDDFEFQGNNYVRVLDMFTSLEWIDNDVDIKNNDNLVSLCNLHTVASSAASLDWNVYGNAYNPTRQEVIDAGPTCPIPAKISGKLFYDKDADGLCGPDEKGLAHVAVLFNSEGIEKSTKLMTDSEGLYTFKFYGPIGDYRLTIDENTMPEGFSYTTPAVIESSIPEGVEYEFEMADFGFNFADSSVVDEHNNTDMPGDDATLTFVEGSPSFIKEPWSRAVDGNVNGWDGTATVGEDKSGKVWAVFEINGGPVVVDKLSIIVDNGFEDDAYEFRHMQEFDLFASATSADSSMFKKVGTFTLGTDWINVCRFGQSVSTKFLKIVINKPNFGANEWRQIVEISIDDLTIHIPKKGIESTKSGELPASYSLSQNYPNPFNPTTSINFALPHADHVDVAVFNLKGDLVKQLVAGYRSEGMHTIYWDATNDIGQKVTTGVYFYRIKAGEFCKAKKMTLMQ
jgi:hypothetical protein